MKAIVILALSCGISLGLVSSEACAQSMAEMREQEGKRLSKADAELNKLYQALLKKRANDPSYVANLKDGQRAWLVYVDCYLKSLFPVKEGENPGVIYGSMYTLDLTIARTTLVEQRVKQLKELLENED